MVVCGTDAALLPFQDEEYDVVILGTGLKVRFPVPVHCLVQ